MENYQVMEIINYSSSSSDHLLQYYQPKVDDDDQRRRGGRKRLTGGAANNVNNICKLSTDPQSVAARQRRHRISDRFRVLKSLVPGGSKMDTVSMLEEAINYVKFLKTQIWFHQAAITIIPPPPPPADLLPLIPFPFPFDDDVTHQATTTSDHASSYMIPPHEEMLCYDYDPTSAVAPPASTTTTTSYNDLPPLPYCSFFHGEEDQMQLQLPHILPPPPLNFYY